MNDYAKDALIKKLEQENLSLRIDNFSLKENIDVIFEECMPIVGEILAVKGWLKVFKIVKLAMTLVFVIIDLKRRSKDENDVYKKDYKILN
tara:strand:+ start:1666 stop:1938 length:273 start_codon:yes stop_codon:yes gene_type:complete